MNNALIKGVSVEVLRPTTTSKVDSMGQPIAGEPEHEAVDNVLFDPTGTSDVSGDLRMQNIEVDADFHFPKSYTKTLRGCSISYGGHTYRVIGEVRRYIGVNVPGNWNGVVSCREVS